VLERAYRELADSQPQIPELKGIVPELLDRVIPVREFVPVDLYLPGCPPNAKQIQAMLEQLLAGETPHLTGKLIKFG